MGNLLSIARPYAVAAFDFAREKDALLKWNDFLASGKEVAKNSKVVDLLNNPEVSNKQLFELFNSVLASIIDQEQKNFLFLLAENKRLVALPEIADEFSTYYRAYQKIFNIRVITAVPISDDYKKTLSQALSKRIQHDVMLNCEIDASILGGAIIHIGDRVIDGSVRGKLSRMLENLTG